MLLMSTMPHLHTHTHTHGDHNSICINWHRRAPISAPRFVRAYFEPSLCTSDRLRLRCSVARPKGRSITPTTTTPTCPFEFPQSIPHSPSHACACMPRVAFGTHATMTGHIYRGTPRYRQPRGTHLPPKNRVHETQISKHWLGTPSAYPIGCGRSHLAAITCAHPSGSARHRSYCHCPRGSFAFRPARIALVF